MSTGLARFTLPGAGGLRLGQGAVEVLTRYMAKELGDAGIRVNVVAPGAIASDFGGGVVRDNPDLNRLIAGTIPLGRVGLPDDIGRGVAAILSDDFAWPTARASSCRADRTSSNPWRVLDFTST